MNILESIEMKLNYAKSIEVLKEFDQLSESEQDTFIEKLTEDELAILQECNDIENNIAVLKALQEGTLLTEDIEDNDLALLTESGILSLNEDEGTVVNTSFEAAISLVEDKTSTDEISKKNKTNADHARRGNSSVNGTRATMDNVTPSKGLNIKSSKPIPGVNMDRNKLYVAKKPY